MSKKSSFHKGFIPPALSFLIASGLILEQKASSASLWLDCVSRDDSDGILSQSVFTRTSALWSNPQWQEFKRIWRKLDRISPVEGDYGASPLAPEEINRIRIELDRSLIDLLEISDEIGIDSLDIRLLRRLASDRLTFLSYGMMMPLTRMMPPPVSDQTDNLLPEIEARIDALMLLRESELISSDEMTAAFTNLRTTIDTYYILETIRREIGYSGLLWSVRWPLEPHQIQFHLDSIQSAVLGSLNRSSGDMEEYNIEQLDELDRIQSSLLFTLDRLPALHDLLMDLELF